MTLIDCSVIVTVAWNVSGLRSSHRLLQAVSGFDLLRQLSHCPCNSISPTHNSVISVSFDHPLPNKRGPDIESERVVSHPNSKHDRYIDQHNQPIVEIEVVAPSIVVWADLRKILYDEIEQCQKEGEYSEDYP